ncbi:MAG: hypothetical protein OXN84_06420, partial [Albidovulum sp.]|nr:hypothetical protein [Albidovulum sp.]
RRMTDKNSAEKETMICMIWRALTGRKPRLVSFGGHRALANQLSRLFFILEFYGSRRAFPAQVSFERCGTCNI